VERPRLRPADPTWRSGTGDSPIGDLSNLLCIAEVVRRFDVIAVQEVRRSGQASLATLLGWHCDLVRRPWGARSRIPKSSRDVVAGYGAGGLVVRLPWRCAASLR
jgi:endonuclease/exonuclease/phosphatase family metal-dependent hydrolase